MRNPQKHQFDPQPEKEYISCSFRYLTTNNKYLIDKFQGLKNNVRKKAKCYESLFKKLHDLQCSPWEEIGRRPKESGYETLPIARLNFNANGLQATKDSKFHSIRFHNQEYRIIAYKDPRLPILYIIGFDLDYTAYDHGS